LKNKTLKGLGQESKNVGLFVINYCSSAAKKIAEHYYYS